MRNKITQSKILSLDLRPIDRTRCDIFEPNEKKIASFV